MSRFTEILHFTDYPPSPYDYWRLLAQYLRERLWMPDEQRARKHAKWGDLEPVTECESAQWDRLTQLLHDAIESRAYDKRLHESACQLLGLYMVSLADSHVHEQLMARLKANEGRIGPTAEERELLAADNRERMEGLA